MNDDVIQDLKQFISATVSQQMSLQLGEFREEMNQRFEEQSKEFNDRFDEQDEMLNEILNAVGGSIQEVEQKVDDHETRLKRLERKAA